MGLYLNWDVITISKSCRLRLLAMHFKADLHNLSGCHLICGNGHLFCLSVAIGTNRSACVSLL